MVGFYAFKSESDITNWHYRIVMFWALKIIVLEIRGMIYVIPLSSAGRLRKLARKLLTCFQEVPGRISDGRRCPDRFLLSSPFFIFLSFPAVSPRKWWDSDWIKSGPLSSICFVIHLPLIILPNPSSRTMALGSTQPLTEVSTRNPFGCKGRPPGA
jgi:hypothetical protein